MQPEQRGAFCNACSKVVIDFTQMSDEELIQYFESKKDERICGRFKSSQLETPVTHTFHLSQAKVKGGLKGVFLVSLFAAFTAMFNLTSCTNQVMGEPVVINDLIDTISLPVKDTTTVICKDTIESLIVGELAIPEVTMGIIQQVEPVIIEEPVITPEPIQEPERIIMGKMVPPDRRPKNED